MCLSNQKGQQPVINSPFDIACQLFLLFSSFLAHYSLLIDWLCGDLWREDTDPVTFHVGDSTKCKAGNITLPCGKKSATHSPLILHGHTDTDIHTPFYPLSFPLYPSFRLIEQVLPGIDLRPPDWFSLVLSRGSLQGFVPMAGLLKTCKKWRELAWSALWSS